MEIAQKSGVQKRKIGITLWTVVRRVPILPMGIRAVLIVIGFCGPTQPVRRTNILVQELYTVVVSKKNVKNVAIQNKELMVESG